MRAVPPSRWIVFFVLAAAGCAVDLSTKHSVFAWLGMPGAGRVHWVWQDVFGFQTSLNPGALFGMGQGMWVLFSALSVLAALAILYWLFIAGAARDLLLTVALGCVMAGIVGNLYDRLAAPHLVRDWILMFKIGDWSWPNYNIADSLLVCGAILLVWHAFVARPQAASEPGAADSGK